MSTAPLTPAAAPLVIPVAPVTAAVTPPPTVGRIVHYSMLDPTDYRAGSPYMGQKEVHIRPAIIVEVQDAATGLVNLQVFIDGANDGYSGGTLGTLWKPSIEYAAVSTPGKWSWPPVVK
jgi:hypothetical protein